MGDILTIIAKRLGLGLITLLVISIIIFFAVELLPGDIAQAVLGQGATEDNLAALRAELGLDRAAPIRYFEWLGNAVTGDFGNSLVSKTPVAQAIGTRFGNTLFLAVYAAIIAVPVAIFLGVLVALFRNSVFDRVANVVTLTSISSPGYLESSSRLSAPGRVTSNRVPMRTVEPPSIAIRICPSGLSFCSS